MVELYKRLLPYVGGYVYYGKLSRILIYSDDEILQKKLFTLASLGLIKIRGRKPLNDWAEIYVYPGKRLTIKKNGIIRVDDIQERRLGHVI